MTFSFFLYQRMPGNFEELLNEDKTKEPKDTCIKSTFFYYLLILLSGTQFN